MGVVGAHARHTEAPGCATLSRSPDAAEDAVGRAGDVGAVLVTAGLEQLVFFERDEANKRGRDHGRI
jgi:hypothetical protein